MDDHPRHPASFVTLALVLCGATIVILSVAAAIGWQFYKASSRESVGADPQPSIEAQAPHRNPPADLSPVPDAVPAVDEETTIDPEDSPQAPAPPPEPTNSDDEIRRLLTGTWEDDYQGKRTMTLAPDGTGTMVVELSGVSGAVFGSRLKFDMEWSLDEGRLIKRTVGGEPKGKVKTILAMMGDRAEEEIIELTQQRLLVEDLGMQKRFDWRRVTAESQQ